MNSSILPKNRASIIHDTSNKANKKDAEKKLEPSGTKKAEKKKATRESFGRIVEFPGNNNFNGKPLVQQLEIKSKILSLFPDTLKQIAKESYLSFESFFPVSIADNFEKGISTKQIYYPKLIFQLQVFENVYASEPYLEKMIVVKKETNGELTVE